MYDIRAVEFTSSSDGDRPFVGKTVSWTVFCAASLQDLLGQIPEGEEIGTVTANGASGRRRSQTTISDRQATAIIPIRKNGGPWKEDCPAARGRN